jgi:hypothetical protein
MTSLSRENGLTKAPSASSSETAFRRRKRGVVVLDDNQSLPEGAVVSITYPPPAPKGQAVERRRVQFPLVRSAHPASVDLTNERIAEIFDEEDAPPGR